VLSLAQVEGPACRDPWIGRGRLLNDNDARPWARERARVRAERFRRGDAEHLGDLCPSETAGPQLRNGLPAKPGQVGEQGLLLGREPAQLLGTPPRVADRENVSLMDAAHRAHVPDFRPGPRMDGTPDIGATRSSRSRPRILGLGRVWARATLATRPPPQTLAGIHDSLHVSDRKSLAHISGEALVDAPSNGGLKCNFL
jgi:hypothetical protein